MLLLARFFIIILLHFVVNENLFAHKNFNCCNTKQRKAKKQQQHQATKTLSREMKNV